MNIFLWILQGLIALHTIIGAIWKFSHTPEQTMPSLATIPNGAWHALCALEILCAIAIALPAINKSYRKWVPSAALLIAAEMLLFCGVHLTTGDPNFAPIMYWLTVAAICTFLAYGRFKLKPIR